MSEQLTPMNAKVFHWLDGWFWVETDANGEQCSGANGPFATAVDAGKAARVAVVRRLITAVPETNKGRTP